MTQPVNAQPASGAALNPRLQEIADDFHSVPDKDRLQLLLEFSQDLPPLPERYERDGITPDKDVIAYCRIGERSSHTWFALHELLGYPKVRNYDGSWTEWGSMIGVPIEK